MGGVPQWIAKNKPVTSKNLAAAGADQAQYQCIQEQIYNSKQVLKHIDNPNSVIIDARSRGRFLGQSAEPRPGLRSGHIPRSINLPFAQVLQQHSFKSQHDLKQLFTPISPDSSRRLIFSCGSGITACILLLAAYIAGYRALSLYDGSWSEWGASEELPVSNQPG